jgi:molybdopterin-guanine dinucleotide biosynthesis protein B
MIPIIAIVGRAKSGKTTLVEKLVAEFRRRGIRVATLKHAPHGFDLDRPGSDSRRHKAAGAVAAGLIGPDSIALVADAATDFGIADYFPLLEPFRPDLLIVEGFKSAENVARIEVACALPAEGLLCAACPEDFLALASDTVPAPAGLRQVSLSDVRGLADLIAQQLGLPAGPSA